MAELATTSLFNDANLVSYYKLEDVNDSKASNNLTNNGSVTFAPAKFNNGADLGATNTTKSLSFAGNMGIAGNSDLSFTGWLKLRTEITAGQYTFLEHASTTTADRYFQLRYEWNGGTIRIGIQASGTLTTFTTTLGTSSFHHVVVTRNVSGNTAIIYLDNVSVASGALGSTGAASNIVTIGSDEGGGSLTSAIFDDVGIFNRVLTPAEVSTLFNPLATVPVHYAFFM